MRNVISWLLIFLLTGGLVVVARDVVSAHGVPQPKCDFMTGGGWVFKGANFTEPRANFGAHGGCKNEAFWGNVNFLDHTLIPAFHMHGDSKMVTGYLCGDINGNCSAAPFPTERDTCGWGRIVKGGLITSDGGLSTWSDGETVFYRWSGKDVGEPGGSDTFGIRIRNDKVGGTKEYLLRKRELGPSGATGGGGNIQLHKPNPSTTPPSPLPSEFEMCGDLASPD